MTLVRQLSKRTDSHGRPYWDYFLLWRYEDKTFYLRVDSVFVYEKKFLHAAAIEVPQGELLEKYAD